MIKYKLTGELKIELQDERNILIRQKAKAKSADIIQWLMMIIAYFAIFANAPLWEVTFDF